MSDKDCGSQEFIANEAVDKVLMGELTEADLEGVVGGWTKNRYDAEECKYINLIRCNGLNLIPCDHYRKSIVVWYSGDNPASGDTYEKETTHSCAWNCYVPYKTKTSATRSEYDQYGVN